MPRGVIIILDGLGDRPVESLGGRTPLEAAHTPNLDALAASGMAGQVIAVPDGQQAHTHLGVGLLFGLAPDQASLLARGPIEASGIGWDLAPGDVAIRVNFATLLPDEQGYIVLDRRAGRIDEGTEELAQQLQDLDLGDGVTATLRSTEQHRAVLVLSGPGLDARVTDCDPGNVSMPARLAVCQPTADTAGAVMTAQKINYFMDIAHERLHAHPVNGARIREGLLPANGVLGRGAGHVPAGLGECATDGLHPAVVAGCSTVIGLSRLLGLDTFTDERFSADLETDLDAKIAAVKTALGLHDLVYLHIKAPDICAHDRQPDAKREVLERVDAALAPLMNEDVVIGLCADHGTDSNTGWHIDDPVPALIGQANGATATPGVEFGEAYCAAGGMGQISSSEFIRRLAGAIEDDVQDEKI